MPHKTFPKEGIKKLKETIRDLKTRINELEKEIRFLKSELVNTIPDEEDVTLTKELSREEWRKEFLRRIKDGK